jgi:uncharacterized protein YggE
MRKTWMLVLAVFTFAILMGCTMQVNPNQQIPQITSNGQGQVRTDPDQVTASVQVLTQGKVASEAQTYNKQLSNKVKDSFVQNGLTEQDIETESYNVNPERVYIPPKDSSSTETYKIQGYTVTNTFKITVKDLDKIGEIVDDAVKAGANSVDNVAFGLSREKEVQVKGDALKLAAGKAKEKAQAMADSLGVHLGRVLSASESAYYTPYVNNFRLESKAMMADAAAAPTPITPGKVDVDTTVDVVYEINQ